MTNFDYYAVARDLIQGLVAEGYPTHASKLQDAIDNGSTGTEILMALRFNLNEISKKVSLSPKLLALISTLLVELNSVLG